MPNYNILSQGSTKIAKSNKIQDKYLTGVHETACKRH
jgi:hypothetical protein